MKARHRLRIPEPIRQYRQQSLFIRTYLYSISLVVLPLIALSVFIYINSVHSLRSETKLQAINSLNIVGESIDNIVTEVTFFAASLSLLEETEMFMLSENPELTIGKNPVDTLTKVIKAFSLSNRYIRSIYIFSEISGRLISFYGVHSLETFDDTSWYPLYQETPTKKIMKVLRPVHEGYPYVLTIILPVAITDSSKQGVIVASVNIDRFKRFMDSQMTGPQETLIITDPDNRVMFADNHEALNQKLEHVEPEIAPLIPPTGSAVFLKDRSTFLVSRRSKSIDWTYLMLYRLNSDVTFFRRTTLMFIGFFTLSLVTAILASFFIARYTYTPIQKLMAVLKDEKSNYKFPDGKQASAEIRFIAANIARFISKNRHLEDELANQVLSLDRARYIALQSQINPHFLFNTLETINWAALKLKGGENRVSTMITHLSELLHLSLEESEDWIPLSQELRHANLYLEILKLRYPENFAINWEITESTSLLSVPKLILQPLLENAMYHGIKPLSRPGTISVQSNIQGNILRLAVSDDGIGMSETTVEALNSDLKEDLTVKREHIGIRNVNQRIRLLCGCKYGISIQAGKDGGVVAIISLLANHG